MFVNILKLLSVISSQFTINNLQFSIYEHTDDTDLTDFHRYMIYDYWFIIYNCLTDNRQLKKKYQLSIYNLQFSIYEHTDDTDLTDFHRNMIYDYRFLIFDL